MNTDAGRKDPKVVSRLIDLVESGLNPDEIGKVLEDEAEKAALEEYEGPEEEERFSSEIKIIAQALAYRQADPSDLPEIMALLTKAYEAEVSGPESYREGASLHVEQFINLFEDKSYKWLVCEAPNGNRMEKDGVILGISIYSTDGISRCNGEVEGNLGSIRLFAVLPRFHGLCIGLRLLKKTEAFMLKAGCVRCMACTATARRTVATWLKRRGYNLAGTSPYPAQLMGHVLKSKPAGDVTVTAKGMDLCEVRLMQFLKKIFNTEATLPSTAEKKPAAMPVPTVLRLVGDEVDVVHVEKGDEEGLEGQEPEESEEAKCKRLGVPYVSGKMHLPPHWRHAGASAPTVRPDSNANSNDIPLD